MYRYIINVSHYCQSEAQSEAHKLTYDWAILNINWPCKLFKQNIYNRYFQNSRVELCRSFSILVFTSQQLFNASENDNFLFCYFFQNGLVNPDKEKISRSKQTQKLSTHNSFFNDLLGYDVVNPIKDPKYKYNT